MTDRDNDNELPGLNDDQISLLYEICLRASQSPDAPFKALFAAYDAVFAERQLDPGHDDPIFRYLMRVGDSTVQANRERRPVDLVRNLKDILEALGITILTGADSVTEQFTTRSVDVQQRRDKPRERTRRRVSFDDARYEETWLSGHTESIVPASLEPSRDVLHVSKRNDRAAGAGRRARSTSAQRGTAKAHTTRQSSRSTREDELGDVQHVFDEKQYVGLNQDELEEHAEAFLDTSAHRYARQALHAWHESTVQLSQARQEAYDTAALHDRRALLLQAFDLWRNAAQERREQHLQEQREEQEWKRRDLRAQRSREYMLIRKAFTHWTRSAEEEKLRTREGYEQRLAYSYFRRWKAITAENQLKFRRILCRKYLAIWRRKVTDVQESDKLAEDRHAMSLLRNSWRTLFWAACEKRVDAIYESKLKKQTFGSFRSALELRRLQDVEADRIDRDRVQRRSLAALSAGLHDCQQMQGIADRHFWKRIAAGSLESLRAEAKLAPVCRRVQAVIDTNLAGKAFRTWHQNLVISRQASEVDRRRLLQTAWTNWNDALRSKALAQKIDERVLVQNLYKWVLHERLRLFQRTIDSRILARALEWWRVKVVEGRDQLADAEIVFAERQRRRRLAFGIRRLNIAVRTREDAERAAVEFAMGRALPKALDAWKRQTDHARRLAKMAADARFYCLCSNALSVWKEKTTEHVANRRREAYLHVRARVKTRLAAECLNRLRTTCQHVRSLSAEAEERRRAVSTSAAIHALEHWRDQTARCEEIWLQAYELDRRKLQNAAFAVLRLRYADHQRMEQQALDFAQETEQSILAGALRRLQWANFTVARKVESADALRARNRDLHLKQMLRHWATQTAIKRTAAAQTRDTILEEPESPSLRPASRAASRTRSGGRDLPVPSSPPMHDALQSTPGYMRTPSRPRRAGRFRPLPTPAGMTPLAFSQSYLVTTPAPTLPVTEDALPGEGLATGLTEGLTPQITPFARKLRAGGLRAPTSVLRGSEFRRSVQGGTNKSVRFAGTSRFGRVDELHAKNS